jgi:putative NADH-flavin reductase
MSTYLVFGATGGTGKHFLPLALGQGHIVRVLVRNPTKLAVQDAKLQVQQGSITDATVNLDKLLEGADFVISMLGDREAKLIPAMRRHGVKRFLYQAGGLSTPYKGHLSPLLWTIRHTVAHSFEGQHRDNEAVMAYLAEEAKDLEWMVHRAGIGGDGPSKGTLQRSPSKFSVGTHRDCAAYNYRTLNETAAIHTSDFSHYVKE